MGIPHGFEGPSETASKRIVLPGIGDGGSIRSGKMSAIPEASPGQGSTEVKGDDVEQVDLLGDEETTQQDAPAEEADADAVAERVKAIIPIEREEAGDPDVLEAELVLEGDSGNSSETDLGRGASTGHAQESSASSPVVADAEGAGEGEGKEDENTALLSNGPRAGAGAGAGANGDGKGKDKKKKKKKGKK